MKYLIALMVLVPLSLKAQNHPLEIFKALEEYTWHAEGNWGDGSTFKQEITYTFTLNDKIVKVETLGYINQEHTEFGLRNHGIRQFNQELNLIRFWEFDVFGGVTEGLVRKEGRNLIYTYEYGGTNVTEMWIYKNETTYDFIVGVFEDGNWQQTFLETEFIGKLK